MASGRPKGKMLLGFNAPEEMVKKLDEIAVKRGGVNRTVLLTEAVTEFIERNTNPDIIKDQIRQALREEPGLVAEAVQIYAARKLQK